MIGRVARAGGVGACGGGCWGLIGAGTPSSPREWEERKDVIMGNGIDGLHSVNTNDVYVKTHKQGDD